MSTPTSSSQSFPVEFDTAFGERLRVARVARRISQQELADSLNSTYAFNWRQTTVGRVEAGARRVMLSEAVAAAQILGVELDQLAFGQDQNVAKLTAMKAAYESVAEELHRVLDVVETRWRIVTDTISVTDSVTTSVSKE